MPADEDYNNRRQITLQHASPSPAPAPCPVGCPAATVDHLQYVSSPTDLRYASEKNLQSERFEAPTDHRFSSERGSSDRLPSGERYQGVSERYPLGERPHTSVSSERLATKEVLQGAGHERQPFVPERYQYAANQRYSDRLVSVQNIGSLDRYHNHASLDKYQRTNTPTEKYHTLSSTDKERCSSSAGRCTPVDKYSIQAVEPAERYNHNRNNQDQYSESVPQKSEIYGKRSDRKSDRYLYQNRYNHEQYLQECYGNNQERFPAIPCPERFATEERISFTQVPYMEPPSPAPANDRFIPPPPLSPEHARSPDCFPSNPFPSPTTTMPPSERFIPPPPLSPSPTDAYSPKKIKARERYSDRYVGTNERFLQCPSDRYKDRSQYYVPQEKYCHQNVYHQNDKYVNVPDRYSNNERYIPPNAHMPVERYIPQPQDHYYGTYQTYDRFSKFSGNDPYMRRDLTFHYRLPLPYPANQYQRIRYTTASNRAKCCQYQDGYHLSKSSPGSSSSSSVTSQGKDIQQKDNAECQNYQGYQQQQEKAIQCNSFQNKDKECSGYLSPNVLTAKGQCRHVICASPGVEYVGQSGGRHVCATPPPRGSIGSGDSVCSDQCCTRRTQSTLAVAVW